VTRVVTIAEASERLARGDLTSERLTEECLAQIASLNPELNAFITVTADDALRSAHEADREIAAGRTLGSLHGIPLSIKDLIDQAGLPTTAGSRVRAEHRATADAPVVARLRDAGAVFVGKTNLHEFAFGTTNEDSGWGPARHPVNPRHSPGGSSGGSAIAVRTGMSLGPVGTDTGGSIRIPAAACGLVGLKPEWNDLSTDGVVPLSRQLDHVGPLARSVTDAWLLYETMRGSPRARGETLEGAPMTGLRLGLLGAYFFDLIDPAVERVVLAAIERLRRTGVSIIDKIVAHANDIATVYLHLVLADGAAYHATALERRPQDYTPNVRLRLEMGRYVLGEDYSRALHGRAVLRRGVDRALEGVEALVLPALAIPAPPIGEASVAVKGSRESVRTIMLRCTQLFNLTGHPAVTVPCGLTPDGWPVGLQLVGRPGGTADLLRVARAFEGLIGERG
jgi:aspartyl-tRNA(Asn)/glutamyl-tRNA(Gln) amidotransferase subunit A